MSNPNGALGITTAKAIGSAVVTINALAAPIAEHIKRSIVAFE